MLQQYYNDTFFKKNKMPQKKELSYEAKQYIALMNSPLKPKTKQDWKKFWKNTKEESCYEEVMDAFLKQKQSKLFVAGVFEPNQFNDNTSYKH